MSGEECSGNEHRDLQALLVHVRNNTLDTARTGMSLLWHAESMSVAQHICNMEFHTFSHTHTPTNMRTHTHTHTHSNVHRWKKQTNESHAFPKPHLNNCMHICTFKQQWFYINRHTKHFLYKQKHSFQVHRLRHHLLSCTLLVLHTFLSSMHSSRCSPDATHHWPFILQTKKSMFIPIAWAHTPTRLQREAEMRKGIKKLLFSPLLWP